MSPLCIWQALLFTTLCTMLLFPAIISTAITLDHDAKRGRMA